MALGALFNASHASMRDAYEVSTPEVDILAALGREHADVYGARLTGGGFGGAVIMLARAGSAARCASEISAAYRQRTGLPGAILVPVPQV
jgi:galactokinase